MIFIAKDGWPVERIRGRWFLNLVRLVILTRRIKFGKYDGKGKP